MKSEILILVDHLRNDGTPNFITRLSKQFYNRGHTVKIIYLNNSSKIILDKLESNGIIVKNYKLKSIYAPLYLIKLFKLLSSAKQNQSIVLSFLLVSDLITSILNKLIKYEKIFFCIRANYIPMYNFLVSYSYSKIVLENSNIIFNSKSVCSFYQNYFNTVSFQPQIIPNFISEDDFSDFKLKTDYEIKNSYITVISTARLEYQKGLDTLLKSISNIKSIKIKVIILGEGSQKNNLIKLAKDLNIELFLPGVVKNIYSFISESDIYVQPSRFEGMPNGLMEAMLCGLPCIGSNIEGINELIDNNNSGLLFEKEKYQELSFLIEQLITNKQLREQLGQNARKKLLDDFNANKIIDIWLQNF